MRKLILHAGLPKTGTTTIQNAFWRVRDRLLATEGLLYPPPEPNHTNAICTMFLDDPMQHISNRMAARDGAIDLASLQGKYRAQIEEHLARSDWKRVLISAEGLSNLAANEIAKLRDWMASYVDEMEVVFWVREPVAYVTSVAQQLLKGGETLKAMQSNPLLPNFKGKISNAIKVFGRDAVRVRSFEEAVTDPKGITAYYARDVGLSPEGVMIAASAATFDNESLSAEAARMLDHLNGVRPIFGEGSNRRSGHEVLHLQTVKGNKFALPEAMRQEIYASTRADVAWLNETFGLSLYLGYLPQGEDENKPMRLDTLQSASILVSNLINANQALTLALQAHEAVRNGNVVAAKKWLERAHDLSGGNSALIENQSKLLFGEG